MSASISVLGALRAELLLVMEERSTGVSNQIKEDAEKIKELEAVAVEEMDEMGNEEADSNACVAFLLDISTFDAKVFP